MPDSCCKTVVARCGQRAHPSNIYKVEVSTQAPPEACRGPPLNGGLRQRGRGGAEHTCSSALRPHRALSGLHEALGQAAAAGRFWDIMACPWVGS